MQQALTTIQTMRPGFKPSIAVILGSGWGGLVAQMRDITRISYSSLVGFPQSTVAGHSGELCLGFIGDTAVAVMSGRKHGYETGAVDGMKIPLKTLKALGCSIVVQTNAAGSLQASMPPGSLMLLSDHINGSQRSPLVGEIGSEKFVNMVDAYDPALRAQARQSAQSLGINVQEGVYAWYFGPQFETPAEIRMFAALGANAVGMSTVPETILARHMGLRVLAVSLITNLGAGLSSEKLSHAHTLAQAELSGAKACAFLAATISSFQIDKSESVSV